MLGGLALEDDGEPLAGRAAQKRRLAILALLATAPARTMSRDRLMALIWPDKDAEQARHLVSVAVYEIRKELGDDVITTRGDDLILEPSLVATDIDAFDAAVEAGELERAIEIHAGPFLDGFHLGGSTEFDQWADLERDRRERALLSALESLAESRERAGDATGAVAAWRRLANHERYDSRIAVRLLRALQRAGNPAGALQFARVHAALLMQEFGTDPPPEFDEVVEELRSGAAPPPAPASDPSDEPTAGSPTTAPEAVPADVASEPVAHSPGVDGAKVLATRRSREGGTPSILRPLIILTLILVGAGAGGYLATRGATPAEGVGVAVLPFDPMSTNEDDEAYADGLTEEIMNALGYVDGVRVPARSASFALRGVDAPEAAARLGVEHIVEGSVRREGEQLRIRVELSGADGFNRWSKQYDRSAGEVLDTWKEIAQDVLRELEVELAGGLRDSDGGTADPVAFDLYQKGRHAWFKRTPTGLLQALEYFGQATARDPRYARAYVGIADVYNLLGAWDYGVLPPDSAYPAARAASTRALSLAPRLAEAHAARANTLFAYDRDLAGAEESYRAAIRLNDRYAEAHHWYGLFLLATGREDESIVEAERALALDSLSPIMRTSLARQRYFRGDYAAALRGYQSALALEPTFLTAHHGLGLVLLQLGRHDDAAATFRTALDDIGGDFHLTLSLLAHALARSGRMEESAAARQRVDEIAAAGGYVSPESRAIIHLGQGDYDAATDALYAALEANSGAIAFLGVEPLVDPLRGNDRFERLLELAEGRAR